MRRIICSIGWIRDVNDVIYSGLLDIGVVIS